MNILELPDCMIEQVFEYLSYDEIANKRLVCRKINEVCQQLLNRGFNMVVRRHSLDMKKLKALLPRRESERRHHVLVKHADILTCIETRISMLTMTYGKYIETNLCCFIPGKIIDEMQSILRLVHNTPAVNNKLRAHEVLQELRDISSMAIDHFDEKIANDLKKSYSDLNAQKFGSSLYQIMQSPIETTIGIHSDFLSSSLSIFRTTTTRPVPALKPLGCQCPEAITNRRGYIRLNRKYNQMMRKMTHLLSQQDRQLRIQRGYALNIAQMSSQIDNLRRRLEEAESKNREIAPYFNHLGETSGSRNIKPRAATIILKRRIESYAAAKRLRELRESLDASYGAGLSRDFGAGLGAAYSTGLGGSFGGGYSGGFGAGYGAGFDG